MVGTLEFEKHKQDEFEKLVSTDNEKSGFPFRLEFRIQSYDFSVVVG
jgi:hypothetical protein